MSPNVVLNRLAFGATRVDVDRFRSLGLNGWLDEQLQPEAQMAPALKRQLDAVTLRISYPAREGRWEGLNEVRPLSRLTQTAEELASLFTPGVEMSGPERERPRQELVAASVMRAVYSPSQLGEVLVDFWYNHFSVNGVDNRVGHLLPVYDREVIRPNALGNFRQLLESVAKSACMLIYLNNKSSRAGAPNENYARELFELHTLGRGAYLNDLYDRWRNVPGADVGKPVGYIDQDIYEAARAFTGWTLQESPDKPLNPAQPIRRGSYVYVPSLHDNYQKRILATELQPFQANEADGRTVLDLAAFHPATAKHLCRKLCIRLLGENPPESLVSSSSQVWTRHQDHPSQIAMVVRHIARSTEFASTPPSKIKRPLELIASFIRGAGIDFKVTDAFLRQLEGSGQRLFGWPSPDGHPESDLFWSGVNVTRRRWALLAGVIGNSWGTGEVNPFSPWGNQPVKLGEFLSRWSELLLGRVDTPLLSAMVQAGQLPLSATLSTPAVARRYLLWFGMSPAFLVR